MLKPQIEKKEKIVRDIQEKVAQAQIGILADFTGLSVSALGQLRRQVKEVSGEVKVAKNTLLKRAAAIDGSLIASLTSQMTGPNALTLGFADPVALAKTLVKFAQEKPLFKIKGGAMGSQVLTRQDIDTLSKLPGREVLLAQLLGVMQGVPTALVTVLTGVIRNLLNLLVARKEQLGGGPAPKEPAPEAPAAE